MGVQSGLICVVKKRQGKRTMLDLSGKQCKNTWSDLID